MYTLYTICYIYIYYILYIYTIYYILYILYIPYILYTIYCILYTLYHLLYTICICIILYMHAYIYIYVYYTMYTILSTIYYVRYTVYYVLEWPGTLGVSDSPSAGLEHILLEAGVLLPAPVLALEAVNQIQATQSHRLLRRELTHVINRANPDPEMALVIMTPQKWTPNHKSGALIRTPKW